MNSVFRDQIAEAVHHAVTEITGGDGCGNCDLYSLAGTILLRRVTGKPYQPQIGSLMYLTDPPGNGWFHIDATDGGVKRMEYHAWIGLAGEPTDNSYEYQVGELIDFSTRHLRSMVSRMQQITSATRIGDQILCFVDPNGERIQWTRPGEPPTYIWGSEVPDDFRYVPDAGSMMDYYKGYMPDKSTINHLSEIALRRFHELKSL